MANEANELLIGKTELSIRGGSGAEWSELKGAMGEDVRKEE